MKTKLLLLLLGCSAWFGSARAQEARPAPAPTWPQVSRVIDQLEAGEALADVQRVLQANAALATNAVTDQLVTAELERSGLTPQRKAILSLAQETFRDARAAGLDLAAETLGVRVTMLQLMAAPNPETARAVLVKRRDVTGSPLLDAAFKRLGEHPTLNAQGRQVVAEFAAAFREANDSPDAAVARLLKLAGAAGAGTAPGTAAAAGEAVGGPAAALAGAWRCTTTGIITTDHHMVLNADGTFRSWSHSFNSFSGSESTTSPITGQWTVRGTSLVFTDADGGTREMPFKQSGDTILLPNESSRRLWERVR